MFDFCVAGLVGMPYRACKHDGVIAPLQEDGMSVPWMTPLEPEAFTGDVTTGRLLWPFENLKGHLKTIEKELWSTYVIVG